MSDTGKTNDSIADFMGVLFYDDEGEYYDSVEGLFMGSSLLYDRSWDWLMPVVDKIVNETVMTHRFRKHAIDHIFSAISTVQIDHVYKAAVDFIEAYNDKKP